MAALGALAAYGFDRPAQSQDWPRRSVRVIVPFAPGGATDGIARIVTQHLAQLFGHQFIVENRLGAGGAIAAEAAARAPADGYTLLLATLPQIAIVPAVAKTQYDPVKDFAPITNIAAIPFILVVHPSVPTATLSEFIVFVRERPSKLAYASAGPGSLIHLAMALLLKRAGLEMIHSSYKGSVPAMMDVVAGHVPACFAAVSDAMAQASGGAVRMLAVSGGRRIPQIPHVPTLAESGFPDLTMTAWNGLMAPAGTPTALIQQIAAEVIRALRQPKVIERLASYGADPIGSTPREFAATIAADIPLWAEAVATAGIKQ
jgi:tripartite-type tricarboxylate transporter receptor subunit TctC